MDKYLDVLPTFVDKIREIREIIISNIVLIGQISAPTFHERRRAERLVERFAEFQVDECTIDDFGNPIGVIRGSSSCVKPPYFRRCAFRHLFRGGERPALRGDGQDHQRSRRFGQLGRCWRAGFTAGDFQTPGAAV